MDHGEGSYRRFLAGDKNALVEIVTEYRPGLQNYIHSIVRNFAVAEDLTEETFVKLLVKKPRSKGSASFKTWLYTIGRNIAIDWLRKNPNGKLLALDVCKEMQSDEQAFEELYYREETKKAVRDALDRLHPEYRNVLILSYFEDFSIEEIAKILKKSKKATSVLLHRAKQSLKKQLEKENFTYEDQ